MGLEEANIRHFWKTMELYSLRWVQRQCGGDDFRVTVAGKKASPREQLKDVAGRQLVGAAAYCFHLPL